MINCPSHGSRYWSRDHRRSHDRPQSGKRNWRPEVVVASRNYGSSGLKVDPAPAVAGGSSSLPTSSLPDLVKLFLSLSGPVDQRGAVLGSLLSAAGVTGAGVLPGLAAPVTSAAPVACSPVMTAPGVSTPAGADSATASPSRCERARQASCPGKRRRHVYGRGRSRSGGKHGRGRSPSPAHSAHSASVSASSSSESLDSEEKVSALPPPSLRTV